jgi:serine/threonine protein kinase
MFELPRIGAEFAGYRLESLVQRGGMAVVYLAEHDRLRRRVALKILAGDLAEDDRFRERFLRESRIAAGMDHPNIIPIYDAGESDGLLYIAMRYVEGPDLKQLIQGDGRLEFPRALGILGQVGSALDAAHHHGLIHRDVKPANVLMVARPSADSAEHAYLTDFGLSKHKDSSSGLTQTGQFMGTVDYVSPEQIEGKPVDSRADIYALGCVFYEMLTGVVPFGLEPDLATLWAHVHAESPRVTDLLPDAPAALNQVIACAMAKSPDDRYSTCHDLVAAARAALPHAESPTVVPTEVRPATSTIVGALPERENATVEGGQRSARDDDSARVSSRTPRWVSRHRWPAAATGLALIAGAIVTAVLLSSGSSPRKALGQGFPAELAPVPTNRVDGVGNAIVRLKGNVATVNVDAQGVLNGSPHLMHIHAGRLGTCPPGKAARRHNGKSAISATDGGPYYGNPVVSLTTRGDTSPGSFLDFPRYPAFGHIRYTRTVRLSRVVAARIRADNAVVVIHGIDYNGNGVYDGVLDRSELDHSLEGETTAPALCGPLVGVRSPQRANGARAAAQHRSKRTLIYVASLRTKATLHWLCILDGTPDAALE